MKLSKGVKYGALTMLIGFLVIILVLGIFSEVTGRQLTSSNSNYYIVMALVVSLIFLCSTIVVCTWMIINAITANK